MSVLTKISRTHCLMCDLRADSALCDACKSESRDDFFLLLLTKLKDQGDNYWNLQAKCIDIHDAIEYYQIQETPSLTFDQSVHAVDERARELLNDRSIEETDDMIPVMVAGDGDCLFHAMKVFYPMISIDEFRSRCIDELCAHEQYYSTLKSEMGLHLVDDEAVQEHVLRILDKGQYTGVLTLAALANVLKVPIESLYPNANEDDGYSELLNTVFNPRETKPAGSESVLRIMWSSPEQGADRIWRPNHFVPVLYSKQANTALETTIGSELDDDALTPDGCDENRLQTAPYKTKSSITFTKAVSQEKQRDEMVNDAAYSSKRQIFLEAPAIIDHIITSMKEGKVFDQPPKMVKNSTIFTVKQTEANQKAIAKDANGIWRDMRSVKTLFVLKDSNKYQIVRRDEKGDLFYNERLGNRYIAYPVDPNQVITMQRYYGTNAANPSLRRMIAHSSRASSAQDPVESNLPMFCQYVIPNENIVEDLRLKPHGNAKNSTRPFTSTVPKVLDHIRIYNARRKAESNIEEYLSVMRSLEKPTSMVARFSMVRGEAPVLLISQPHLIQEMKRCCVDVPDNVPVSIICIDTTYNLGRYFVTATTFRNTALKYRVTKKTPIFIGPTMIHYRNDTQSYQELLEYIRHELNSEAVAIGSDGDKGIKKAVDNSFPNATHLYCTRHIRSNIERQLVKCRCTQDERRTLLEHIFDSTESLIQAESDEDFQERLDLLEELWRTIQNRDTTRFEGAVDFINWFNQYQANIFQNHLTAAVRIRINFVDRHGSPRIYHNNDVESLKNALENATNWELKPLSEIIDIVGKLITIQRNETTRALYNAGEMELVPPYSRFSCDPHIWSSKSSEERRNFMEKYYSYIPPTSNRQKIFNIPTQAGKKPNRSKRAAASTKTRKKK